MHFQTGIWKDWNRESKRISSESSRVFVMGVLPSLFELSQFQEFKTKFLRQVSGASLVQSSKKVG